VTAGGFYGAATGCRLNVMGSMFPLLRFAAAIVALALVSVVPQPAPAQEAKPPNAEPAQPPAPPAKLPKPQRGDRLQNLDFLFGALKAAPDTETAKAIEERIWSLWFVSGSDTADLLMTRVKSAFEAKELDLAIKLLDAIVEIKPDYVEAWNRRATIYFMKKDYGHALDDIRQVLAREPRHFGALSGLGLILQEIGDEKHALEAYRRALAIDPHLENVDEAVKNLREKVEGREI